LGSVVELIHHGVAENRADAAAVAPVECKMVSGSYLETLITIPKWQSFQDDIDEAVVASCGLKSVPGF